MTHLPNHPNTPAGQCQEEGSRPAGLYTSGADFVLVSCLNERIGQASVSVASAVTVKSIFDHGKSFFSDFFRNAVIKVPDVDHTAASAEHCGRN